MFAPAAIQLLASKLSAVNGDARRALDTARRTVEKESQKIFESKLNFANSLSPIKSPKKQQTTLGMLSFCIIFCLDCLALLKFTY